MDKNAGLSAAEAARRLGTTIPRVKRALTRLDVPAEASASGRVRIDAATFERLRDELGSSPSSDTITRVQAAVLAALDRAPFGLASVRAVAKRAGVSPTAAGRALEQLSADGLVERVVTRVAAGRARELELLRARRSTRAWRRIAPALTSVQPPRRPSGDSAQVVPVRLRHLFWNVAPAQLDVEHAGGSIARRLVQTTDPEGLSWGAQQLTRADWEHAARTRGLDPRTRRLARNLAAAAER